MSRFRVPGGTGRRNALLLASVAVAALTTPAAAQTAADWKAAPASSDLNSGGNWTQGFVPDNGYFQSSNTTTLIDSASAATFGMLHFQSGATAYTLNNGATFTINGTGIVVDSGAGSFTINNNTATLDFGGSSTIQNNNTANGGAVTINNNTFANTMFTATSSAGNAVIVNNASGGTTFGGSSTAGTATIGNVGESTAGGGAGLTTFLTGTSAGSATISNYGATGTGATGGITNFTDAGTGTVRTTAGTATIHTSGTGAQTNFNGASTAGGANLDTQTGGTIAFNGTSTAANATLTNGNQEMGPDGGSLTFNGNSTAGSAQIFNYQGGTVTFSGASTAGTSVITSGSDHFQRGGSTVFQGNSTAGSATLNIIDGSLSFQGLSTGGAANVYLGATGSLDVSQSSAAFVSVGSLSSGAPAGGSAATVFLGSQTLFVGSNNLDTTFAGTINGSQNVTGGNLAFNGSLIKIGTGTFTLAGSSTTAYGSLGINAGTVAVSQASDLYTGPLGSPMIDFGGGTLRVTHDGAVTFSNNMTAGATANATFDLRGALNMTTLSGSINGTGGLSVTGTSGNELILSGMNAYTGATTVGTNMGLIVGSGGGIGDSISLTVNANAFFTVSPGALASFGAFENGVFISGFNSVAASGTLTNNGSYRDDLNNAGTVVNTGTFIGNVASNTGSVTNSGSISGTVNTSGTFTNQMGGTVAGLVTNSGTGSNAGSLNGGLTNTGGTFTNTGAIGGTVTVSGGTLTGSGSIALLSIANGATFVPGNGTPGTSTAVTGSLALASGATYQVNLNPTTASFANVTGTAALGGATANANFAVGNYISKQYTILNAGSVSGTFGALTNTGTPANITDTLSYDATHAYLNLKLNFAAPTAANANQQNVANTLVNYFNATGGIPTAFATLNSAQLTQASGEVATDAQKGAFQLMSDFLNMMFDPSSGGGTIGGGGTATGVGAPGFAPEQDTTLPSEITLAYNSMLTKAPPKLQSFEQRWTAWGSAFGGTSHTNGDPAVGSNDVNASDYGFAGGLGYRVSPDTTLGFAVAGGGTNWNLAQGLGSGRSDAFQAGVYGKTHAGPWYLSAALAFADNWFTTNRTSVLGDQLQAKFQGQSYGGRIEAGYRYGLPAAHGLAGLTPYAALQAQSFHTPSYTETDLTGGGFGLAYNAMNATDTRSELGARADDLTMLGAMPLILRARLAWAHDWISNPALTAAFQVLPGSSFVVNGAAPPKDSALTTLGAELRMTENWSLLGKFDGQFAGNSQTYGGTGTLRYSW